MDGETGLVSRQEIEGLVKECLHLLELLDRNSIWNEEEYQKNRSKFIAAYPKWYRSVLPVIRDLLPERADKFQSLFRTTKRSSINDYTYTIQDYIHGIYLENRRKTYTDGITAKKLKEQKEILMAAIPRIDGFSFDTKEFVESNSLSTGQMSLSPSRSSKLLNVEFDDEHYRLLKDEINQTFEHRLFMSTYLLSKNLIENLMVDILRAKFPANSEKNVALYFDREHNVHRDFNFLLESFESTKESFPILPEELDDFLQELSFFKLKEDTYSYSINKIPEGNDLRKYNIERLIEGLLELLDILNESAPVETKW